LDAPPNAGVPKTEVVVPVAGVGVPKAEVVVDVFPKADVPELDELFEGAGATLVDFRASL
jgi:hypothetical protein